MATVRRLESPSLLSLCSPRPQPVGIEGLVSLDAASRLGKQVFFYPRPGPVRVDPSSVAGSHIRIDQDRDYCGARRLTCLAQGTESRLQAADRSKHADPETGQDAQNCERPTG